MQVKSYSEVDIARYQSFYNIQTSRSVGGAEIFADSVAIPKGKFGIIASLSQGGPSQLTTAVGVFLCSPDMAQNSSPLQGALLNPNRIGPMFWSTNATGTAIDFMPISTGYIPIPPLWFIRFVSFRAPAVPMSAGDYANFRLGLAVIPQCEEC